MSTLIGKLLHYEENWCNFMSFFNPYIDPFNNHLTNKMPVFDGKAYKKYPEHNFVYDKLWIVKSQGLKGGKLENLLGKEKTVTYPIFIKPRWGHLSASSKNCFKISSPEELMKYKEYKNMMWSEFIKGTEGMTDYILVKGQIMHQITYVYSEEQNGFTDVWKFISPDSKPPTHITEWVNKHMKNFTGIVNVQYRHEKIIEVGLRLARGGAYIISTDNKALITNINNVFTNNFWDFSLQQKMKFKPFYVFKCFTTTPIIYLFPQYLLDYIVQQHTKLPFYEYYFEPAGKEGMVFLQFMDTNFERGMKTKERIENLFNISQKIMYSFLIIMILLLLFSKSTVKYYFMLFVIGLFLSRFINPMTVNYNLYKAQKQSLFGGGPDKSTELDLEVETFLN
jgi:hypothetical protein